MLCSVMTVPWLAHRLVCIPGEEPALHGRYICPSYVVATASLATAPLQLPGLCSSEGALTREPTRYDRISSAYQKGPPTYAERVSSCHRNIALDIRPLSSGKGGCPRDRASSHLLSPLPIPSGAPESCRCVSDALGRNGEARRATGAANTERRHYS